MAALVGPFAVTGNTTDIHTTAQNPLGAYAFDAAGNKYKYLTGVASTGAGTWVVFDELSITTRMVTTSIGPAAIAMAATVASTYGWYLVEGTGLGNCEAAYADNATVNATATDGSVDDNAVAAAAELNVFGAWGRSAISGTQATFQISNPYKSLALLD